MGRFIHRVASLVVVALLATAIPLASPAASAADVGAAGVTSGNLRSVAFMSATTGFAAADNGVIMKTTDGGESWTQVRAADPYSFRGIDFWDASTGVAVDHGGKVAYTENGGTTWANVDFFGGDMDGGDPQLTHLDVACKPGVAGPDRAIAAAGDPNIFDDNWIGPSVMRTDGVVSNWWPNQRHEDKPYWWIPPQGEPSRVGEGEIRDVEYADANVAWAVGIDTYLTQKTSVILKSIDAGLRWEKASLGTAVNVDLEGISFGTTLAGIVVGKSLDAALNQGRIYRTTDGGDTWTQAAMPLPSTTGLNAVYMSSATQAWAVGVNGSIIRTTNGGANWTACTITGGNSWELHDIEFIPGTTTGWAVGNSGTVLLTTDGDTWRIGNVAPVAVDDTYATPEDTPKVVSAPGVLSNDTDADGNSLTAVKVTDPAHGTVTLNSNGSFTYTPAANWHGEDSFTYKANDGTADSNVATVRITVTPVNDAPVAVDDTYTTDEDTPKVVPAPGVLSNDTDVEGATLTAIKLTNPAHGTVTLNSNGSFTYTPAANWHGEDSFTYKANDGTADSNVATVRITVSPVNDAPVANDDSYAMLRDESKVVEAPGVLANDTDVDGDSLTAIKLTDPAHGTVALNANGSFTYTPTAGYVGEDSFTYKANDGTLDSNTATVTFTVAASNSAPVAVDDTYTTAEDTPYVLAAPGVLSNDTDEDGNPLTAIKLSNPANGTVTLNSNGSFTYTPNANWHGEDSFTYKANDGIADSNEATVRITVTPVNDAPVAFDDTYTTAEDTPYVLAAPGVLDNDTDADDNQLTAIKVTNPANGTVTLGSDGSFTYTPNANWHGEDSFTYKANDGIADSNEATVRITVTPVNDAPVAFDDTYSTLKNTAKVVAAPGVLANDSDVDATDSLDASTVTNPAHGTVTLGSDGSFTYTPATGYVGADSFTYKVNDGIDDSNVATVRITVTALAPVYRFYNSRLGTHFYTASEAEKNNVIATLSHIFTFEGPAYFMNPAANSQPLHRFYLKASGTHFYTANETEKNNVINTLSHVYAYEGPAYNVSSAPGPGRTTVYRFYHRTNGTHFYTASAAERDYVQNSLSHVYQFEGQAFWIGQ